jgi:hypothetical protein
VSRRPRRAHAAVATAAALAACAALVPADRRFAHDVQQGNEAMAARRAADAERWFADAQQVSRQFPANDRRRAMATNLIAGTYHARGNFVFALLYHNLALEAQKKARGPTDPDVARILATRAETYAAMGAFKEAEQDLASAAAMLEVANGADDPEVVDMKRYLDRVRHGRMPGP